MNTHTNSLIRQTVLILVHPFGCLVRQDVRYLAVSRQVLREQLQDHFP